MCSAKPASMSYNFRNSKYINLDIILKLVEPRMMWKGFYRQSVKYIELPGVV